MLATHTPRILGGRFPYPLRRFPTAPTDCCHSGTLLDHQTVQISGAKDGSPPPPQFDMGALAGLFGALGKPDGRDFKNR